MTSGSARPRSGSTARFLALAALSLSVGACGGATSQDVLDNQASSGGTSGTSGTSGGTSGTTSGAVDASTPDTSATCTPEEEPNNSRDGANTLAPTRCGAIQPNSESDWLTFELAATSTSMKLDFDGQVQLKVEVDGQTVILGGGGNGKVPFVKGKRYFVEIKAIARGTTIPWRVDLIEK